jgi:hypothetical protein
LPLRGGAAAGGLAHRHQPDQVYDQWKLYPLFGGEGTDRSVERYRYTNSEVARFIPVPFTELEAAVRSSKGTVIKAWLINPKIDKPKPNSYIIVGSTGKAEIWSNPSLCNGKKGVWGVYPSTNLRFRGEILDYRSILL